VRLISAGLDEVPMVYKNINEVMDAQRDLVDVIARFDPRMSRWHRKANGRKIDNGPVVSDQ